MADRGGIFTLFSSILGLSDSSLKYLLALITIFLVYLAHAGKTDILSIVIALYFISLFFSFGYSPVRAPNIHIPVFCDNNFCPGDIKTQSVLQVFIASGPSFYPMV